MRVLVISDTHGHHENLEKILDREEPFDVILHLGDVYGGEDYIEALADCEVIFVAGNGDRSFLLPDERELVLEDKKIYMCHGHRLNVYWGTQGIVKEGIIRKVDVVMFGHTHVPMIKEKNDLLILNPGSISQPRQANNKPSYIVMEIEKNKKINSNLIYLE